MGFENLSSFVIHLKYYSKPITKKETIISFKKKLTIWEKLIVFKGIHKMCQLVMRKFYV